MHQFLIPTLELLRSQGRSVVEAESYAEVLREPLLTLRETLEEAGLPEGLTSGCPVYKVLRAPSAAMLVVESGSPAQNVPAGCRGRVGPASYSMGLNSSPLADLRGSRPVFQTPRTWFGWTTLSV